MAKKTAKKAAKKATKKSAKKSAPARKGKTAKRAKSSPRGRKAAARSKQEKQRPLPTTRRDPPQPMTIDNKRFPLNQKFFNLRLRGRNLKMSQPTRFRTTDPDDITWTWEVVNNNSPRVMVLHVTPTRTNAAQKQSKRPADETGDLTITIISDGQTGEVTFDDIVFEEPEKTANKAPAGRAAAASARATTVTKPVVTDVKPKKFKFKKKEEKVKIEGTGFTSANATFKTTGVNWTLTNKTLKSATEIRVDATPEKTSRSKQGPKDFNETGDLVVTVDSSDEEIIEVEFEPADP